MGTMLDISSKGVKTLLNGAYLPFVEKEEIVYRTEWEIFRFWHLQWFLKFPCWIISDIKQEKASITKMNRYGEMGPLV